MVLVIDGAVPDIRLDDRSGLGIAAIAAAIVTHDPDRFVVLKIRGFLKD